MIGLLYSKYNINIDATLNVIRDADFKELLEILANCLTKFVLT